MTEKFEELFILHAQSFNGLKHLQRAGWVKKQVSTYPGQDCESVAAHSWAMAAFVRAVGSSFPRGIDVLKLVDLCLFHDLAESKVGDITPTCGVSKEQKSQDELEAMVEIVEQTGLPFIKRLFLEYEEQETLEAKLAKDVDRLDMMMQALHYQEEGALAKEANEFFDRIDVKTFVEGFTQDFAKYLFARKAELDKQ